MPRNYDGKDCDIILISWTSFNFPMNLVVSCGKLTEIVGEISRFVKKSHFSGMLTVTVLALAKKHVHEEGYQTN